MKYRIDVIKKLLNVACSDLPKTNIDLLKIITPEYPDRTIECLIEYTKVLSELGLMTSDDKNFGLSTGLNGHTSYFQTKIHLTHQGNEFIDKLNNEAIWTTVKDNAQSATLGLLKALAPSLLSQYIMSL